MSAKSWVLAAVGAVVVAVAVAGVVQWNARRQASVAARELSASEAPAPATVAVAPATMSAPVAATTPTVDHGLREAEARDAAARSMREDTIAVQKRLRAAETARREEADAIKDGERCIDGQKMKRVDNGWVQAGNC